MIVEKELVKTFIEEPDLAYDFICHKYTELSKEELKDVVLELLYAMRNDEDLVVDAGEELKEHWYYYCFEEEEGETA